MKRIGPYPWFNQIKKQKKIKRTLMFNKHWKEKILNYNHRVHPQLKNRKVNKNKIHKHQECLCHCKNQSKPQKIKVKIHQNRSFHLPNLANLPRLPELPIKFLRRNKIKILVMKKLAAIKLNPFKWVKEIL